MSIGVPYAIGSATSNAAANTLVITAGSIAAGGTGTGAGTTAGDCIIVAADVLSLTETVTNVTDSKSNHYVVCANPQTNIYNGSMWVAAWGSGGSGTNTAALVSGTDTITITYSSATGVAKNAGAIACSGLLNVTGAVDVNPVPTTNAGSTTPAITSGTLAQAGELVVMWVSYAHGGGALSWTAPMTGLLGSIETASNQESAMGATVTSSTASVAYSGTIVSEKWAAQLISVKGSFSITTLSLPNGVTGVPYSQTLTEVNGSTPVVWSISAGSLPAWASLNSSTGVISGTPVSAAGAVSFTVECTDHLSNIATQPLSITVTSNLTITTPSLNSGTDNTAYSSTLAATGGTGTGYVWSLFSGSLPAGLSLSPGGVISGTPAGAGSSFTVEVTDSGSNSTTQAFSITISGRNLLIPAAGFANFGGYPGPGNAAPAPYQAANMANRPLAVVVRYEKFDANPFLGAADVALMAGGQTISARWGGGGSLTNGSVLKWSDITAGTYDVLIAQQANQWAAYGVPIMISWNGEFDGVPAIAASGPASNFAAAWRHIWNIAAPIAPNVIWCWVVTGANNNTQTASMYPGDQYVDWIGFDEYDPTDSKGGPSGTYTPFMNWLHGSQMAGAGQGVGKPVGLFETGVDVVASGGTVSDANVAAWINAVPAAMTSLGISQWMWFNDGEATIQAGSLSATALASIGANAVFNPGSAIPPAAGAPYLIGTNTTNAAGNTLVIQVAETTTAGDGIIVFADVNSGGITVASVADSQGNLYTKEVTQAPAAYSGAGFASFFGAAGAGNNTAALVAGTDTITITYSSSTSAAKNAAACGCSAVKNTGAFDQALAADLVAGSTSPLVTTGTLAQVNEFVAAWNSSGSGGGSILWGGGLTPLATGIETASNQISSLAAEITTSQTAVAAGGTLAHSAKWATMVLALKIGSLPVISTVSLPNALTGAPYSQTVTAIGGLAPYTWSISSGSLPAGLVINSSSGLISGASTTTGTVSFTVEVTDANSNTSTKVLSITTTSNLAVTTTTLPGGITGASYTQALTATGGTIPYAWSVSAGSLPAGLSLDPVAGVISGTLEAAGTTSFTVEVTDAASNTDTQPLSITTTSNLNITTTSLPAASTGAAYSQTLAATGGFGAYTWSLASGSLPSPLTLSGSGVISGTPSGSGTFLFVVEVTDAAGNTDTQALSISVSATVNVCGQAAQAVPLSSVQPPAAWKSLQVPVTNTQGDWMIAVVTWRQQEAGEGVTVHVGDDTCRNFWQPLGQPSGTSSPSGVTRTAIWTAPAAYAAQYVMVAPTGAVQAMACTVLDVSGLSPWQQVASLATTFANNSGSLSALTTGAVSAGALVITASAPDNNADGITLAGSGWTQLPFVHCSNGTDHTADLTCLTAYQVTTSPTSATWSSSAALDSSGIIAAVLLTGTAPVQASLNWPYTVAELAIGAGPSTPADELTWTAVSARALNLQNVVQGAQYNLAALTAGQGVLTLDNPDGALIAPGTGSFAGIDSGTPVRVRQAWTGGAWQIQFNGNGSTAFPQGQTSTVLPVQPGQQYTWTCWGASSQPWASGMFAFLAWQGSGGQTAGTITPSGIAAQLLTVTGTAPAGATGVVVGVNVDGTPPSSITFSAAAAPYDGVAGTLILPPAAAWAGHDGATLTTLAAWTPDPRGAPNACPLSVPFAGYVRTWDQAWDPALYRGRAQATLADAWAYCTGNPQPILIQEILNDQPYAYWPMTDAEGSTQAANFAPGNTLPLTLTGSKYGVGPAQPAFGANSSALLGAQGTYLLTSSVRAQTQAGMWAVTDVPAGETTQGYSLAVADGNMPFLSQTVTYEIWVQPTAPFLTSNDSEVLFLSNASFTNQLSMNFQVSGELQLEDEQSNTYVISNNNFLVDPARLLHVTLVLTRTTYKTYINGSLETSGTFVNSLPLLFPVVTVDGNAGAGGSTSAGAFPGSFNGNFGHLVITPGALTPERIMTHYQAGIAAMTGDSVNDRIERLLQSGNYPGRRVILQDTGTDVTPCASCQDIAGQPVSASIQNVASSTPPAVLAISPPGEVVYLSRDYVWNQPVKWVLGENTANGEIPCLIDFALGYDPARVVNDVQLTQLDNQDIVTPEGQVAAIDAASQAQYGDQPYWVTGYLENDLLSPLAAGPGLLDAANWIGGVNAKPGNRIAQVTVDAAGHPDAWTFVSTVAKGDVITVNKRPPTAAGLVITVTGRVSQTTRNLRWSLEGTTGSVQLLVDIAPELNVLTADDPIRGQLNGQNILAW